VGKSVAGGLVNGGSTFGVFVGITVGEDLNGAIVGLDGGLSSGELVRKNVGNRVGFDVVGLLLGSDDVKVGFDAVGLLLGSDDVGFDVGIKLGLLVVGIDVDDIGSNVGCEDVGLVVTGIAVGVFVEGENDGFGDVGLDVTGLAEGIFVVGMMGDFERSPMRHAPLVCPAYAELQHSS
jgi:hypothetical protein